MPPPPERRGRTPAAGQLSLDTLFASDNIVAVPEEDIDQAHSLLLGGSVPPGVTNAPEPVATPVGSSLAAGGASGDISIAGVVAGILGDTPEAASEAGIESPEDIRALTRAGLVRDMNAFPLKKVDPSVHRDLTRGWLLPYVVHFDAIAWGRWDYWMDLHAAARRPVGEPLLEAVWTIAVGGPKEVDRLRALDLAAPPPIPRIEFLSASHPQTRKMLEQCLNAIPQHGSWRGWSSSTYFDYFLDWLLFGLGHGPADATPPREPGDCAGASDRLYQLFQAGAMVLFPYDYFGDLLAEVGFGKRNGFYPTPLNICVMMHAMVGGQGDDGHVWERVCDPCVGTGRMLLAASNSRLDLYGLDISPTCVKATLANLALYAPWGFKPLHRASVAQQTPSHHPSSSQGRKMAVLREKISLRTINLLAST